MLYPKAETMQSLLQCSDIVTLIKWLYDLGPSPSWCLTLVNCFIFFLDYPLNEVLKSILIDLNIYIYRIDPC